MPYLYRDASHMWKVLNGPIGAEILKKHEASNLSVLDGLKAVPEISTPRSRSKP